MSDDLKTEVAEVEPAVEATATLDEEDIAAQEALEKELAELDGIEKAVVEAMPKATTADTAKVEDDDLAIAQKGIESVLEELHQYFDAAADNRPMMDLPQKVEEREIKKEAASEAEAKLKDLEAEVERVKAQLAAEQEQKQRAAHAQHIYQKLQTFMDHSMAAARAQYSDYDEASQYYLESRMAHFKALSDIYPDSDTEQGALNYVHRELGELIAKCAKDKVNPAEKLYKIAKSLGYKAADQSPKKSVSKADVSNIQRVNFAQKATKTLASTTGVNDVESDVPMSDEEYDEWIQNPENQALIKKRMQMVSY